MPFAPPTPDQILQRIKTDFRIEMGVDPLRRSVEYALLLALMGQSRGHYGYLRFIFAQCFADTAESFYFWRWAAIYGIFQKAAAPWEGVYRFTGTNGTLITALTVVTRSDGLAYQTTEDVTIGSGIADVPIEAIDAGVAGDNSTGQVLVLASPISGVDAEGTVQSTSQQGVEVESPEDGLVRVLNRLQNPPQGGGPGDYVRWALEVAGVTRAWEFVDALPNTVNVLFVRDGDGSGSAIIPDSGERSAVLSHVQANAPITTTVQTPALSALTVNIQITSLVPNDPSVKTAIAASLADFFAREASPAATIALSRIDAAISEATGEISHVLVAPASAVVAGPFEVPILGTITYV